MMVERHAIVVRLAAILVVGLGLAGCANGSLTGGAVTGPLPAGDVDPAKARLAFDPISGPPSVILAELSTALNKAVADKGLKVVPRGDPAADYRVRGYISAISDGSRAILVYVWDIVEQSGRRVRRISGQVATNGGEPGDPWSAIDPKVLAAAAQQTVDALAAWEAGKPS